MANGTRRAHTRVVNGRKVQVRSTQIKAPSRRFLIATGIVLGGGVWLIGGTSPLWGTVVAVGAVSMWAYANRRGIKRAGRRVAKRVRKHRAQVARAHRAAAPVARVASAAAHRDAGALMLYGTVLVNQLRIWWVSRAR